MNTQAATLQARKRPVYERFLRFGFWVCILIAVLVVIRRMVALGSGAASSRPSPFGNLDAGFASHTGLTLAHIIPALCFVLLTPVVVFGTGRFARSMEKVLFPLGAAVGLTAYAMSAYAIGGWIERSAVLVFNSYYLFCLGKAWRFFQQRNHASKRRWLLRGIATLLGIATTRPVMGIFFATSSLTHWQPKQFFGIAFWVGFSINVLLIEAYVRWRENRGSAAGGQTQAGLDYSTPGTSPIQ